MRLLEEIRDQCLDDSVKTTSLLRKALVLSNQIQSSLLLEWVSRELDGYNEEDEVPAYRRLSPELKGHFVGYGRELTNAPIPFDCVPEELRKEVENHRLTQPLIAYEQLLRSDSGVFQASADPRLAPLLGLGVYQQMNCINAWHQIGRGSIESLIDGVRNRLLRFVIELRSAYPEINGDTMNDEEKHHINNIVNNTFYGGSHNISQYSSDVSQAVHVSQTNQSDLQGALEKIGFDQESISEIIAAVESEKKEIADGAFGPRTTSVLTKYAESVGRPAEAILTGAMGGLITELVKRHLGIS